MFGSVEHQFVLSKIDNELKRACWKNVSLVLQIAFIQPKTVYKLRKRRFRLAKVEYRVDIQDRKLLRFTSGHRWCRVHPRPSLKIVVGISNLLILLFVIA